MCLTFGLSWMGTTSKPASMHLAFRLFASPSQIHFDGQNPFAVDVRSTNSSKSSNCRACDDDCRIMVEFCIPSATDPIIIYCVSVRLFSLSFVAFMPVAFHPNAVSKVHKFSSLSNTISVLLFPFVGCMQHINAGFNRICRGQKWCFYCVVCSPPLLAFARSTLVSLIEEAAFSFCKDKQYKMKLN